MESRQEKPLLSNKTKNKTNGRYFFFMKNISKKMCMKLHLDIHQSSLKNNRHSCRQTSDRHNLKYLFKSLRYKLKININKNIKIKFSCCVLIFATAEIRGVSILVDKDL